MMVNCEFLTVDVFTDRRFGGNPLAVFPEADGLVNAVMQALAREFNYAETTFVLPPADPAHTARVRIFTPANEIPFAGHPNVGTAFVLAARMEAAGVALPARMLFEEGAGIVPVDLLRDAAGALIGATLTAPRGLVVGKRIDNHTVSACASIAPSDVVTTAHPPLIASVGLPFAFAEITEDALTRALPDLASFRRAQQRYAVAEDFFALHLYVRDPARPGVLRARMFAPLSGVAEDPATGSANAALAALLASFAPEPDGTFDFDITQGVEMGRPSRLHATATKAAGTVSQVRIGGRCVPVLSGSFRM